MAAPKCLTSASATMLFDGIDMHTYGMTVLSVRNPIPGPVESMVQIYGRDGAFDYSKSLSVRTISVEGEIVADSHSALLTYIDNINALIRVRETGKPFKLVFSDQTDRYWTVRIQMSDMVYKAAKNYGRSMSYSMQFICAKPYAEATAVSSYFNRLTIFKPVAIYNLGTLKAPIQMSLINTFEANEIESASAYNATYRHAFEAGSNATVALEETEFLYGMYSAEVARISTGVFYSAIDMSGVMVAGQDYIIGMYIKAANSSENITISLVMTGEDTIVGTPILVSATADDWFLLKLAVNGEDTVDATSFTISVATGADDEIDSYWISGATCYKTGKRYDANAGSYYNDIPYPYTVGISNVVNPVLKFYSGINIFPYKNGEPLTNWINSNLISITKDPLGDGNVICAQAATTAPYAASEFIYVKQGTKYHVSLKMFMEYYSSGSQQPIIIVQTDEMFNIVQANYFSIALEQSTDYEDLETTITIASGVHCIYLLIRNVDAEYKMYVKDIMVSPEITTGEDVPDYVEPLEIEQSYIGSIAPDDALNIDNENGYARYEDYSAGTSGNAMSGFEGDMIHAQPGYNFLYLHDARRTETMASGTPEEESVGSVGLIWSYRARYL